MGNSEVTDGTGSPPDREPFGRVVVCPESEPLALDHPEVRSFLDYCLKHKPPGEFGPRAAFDVRTMRPWLGNLMILDHLPERNDFCYRLYGTRIVQISGFDMTGKLVSDFRSPVGAFFDEVYRLSLSRRAIVFTRHAKLHAQYFVDWLRVVCPVRHEQGVQLVACNYAVTQDPSLGRGDRG